MDYYADRLGDIVVNDAILPAQWADPRRPELTPEQNLWLAVLRNALAWATCKPRTNPQRVIRAEARDWFLAPPCGPGMTLEFVCDALDLDIDWLRAQVRSGAVGKIPRHTHAVRGPQGRVMTVKPMRAAREPALTSR